MDYSNCKVDDFGHEHEEVPPEQVAFMEMPKFQTGKVRIDFNPNHGMASEGGVWLKDLLNKIPAKHFSRADVAVDIFNHDEIKNYESLAVWNEQKRSFLIEIGAWKLLIGVLQLQKSR